MLLFESRLGGSWCCWNFRRTWRLWPAKSWKGCWRYGWIILNHQNMGLQTTTVSIEWWVHHQIGSLISEELRVFSFKLATENRYLPFSVKPQSAILVSLLVPTKLDKWQFRPELMRKALAMRMKTEKCPKWLVGFEMQKRWVNMICTYLHNVC